VDVDSVYIRQGKKNIDPRPAAWGLVFYCMLCGQPTSQTCKRTDSFAILLSI